MSRVPVMSQVLEKKNLQKAFSKTSFHAWKGIYADNFVKNSVIVWRGLLWQRVGKVFVCLKAATRMMKIGKFFSKGWPPLCGRGGVLSLIRPPFWTHDDKFTSRIPLIWWQNFLFTSLGNATRPVVLSLIKSLSMPDTFCVQQTQDVTYFAAAAAAQWRWPYVTKDFPFFHQIPAASAYYSLASHASRKRPPFFLPRMCTHIRRELCNIAFIVYTNDAHMLINPQCRLVVAYFEWWKV